MFNNRIIKLILISISVFSIIEGSILPYGTTKSGHKFVDSVVCNFESCKNVAQTILNNMDTTVNPCDDFYKFACGGFISNTEIPTDSNIYDTTAILNDVIKNQLRKILEEKIEEHEIEPFKMVKQFYKDCLHSDIVKDDAFKIIHDKMKELGGWPQANKSKKYNNDSWISTIEKSRNLGFQSDYILSMNLYPLNTSSRMIHVGKPEINPNEFGPLYDERNSDRYLHMMVKMAVKMTNMKYEKAERVLRHVLQFEINLNSVYDNTSEDFLTVTIDNMQETIPSINSLRRIKALVGNSANVNGNTIVKAAPEYLKNLEILLKKTSRKTLINYILWRNIQESLGFYFFNSRDLKWRNCLATTREKFKLALGGMYYRRYFPNRSFKENFLEIVRRFKKEQNHIILNSDWIDEETRKAALKKSRSLEERVVYPEQLWDDKIITENYKNLHLEPGNYFDNSLKMAKYNMNQTYASFQISLNSSDYRAYPDFFNVNAHYNRKENCIGLVGAMLQGNFYSEEWPHSLNYGVMALWIGHELSHAFDYSNIDYDADGNENWWDTEVAKNYTVKANCFINQYNAIVEESTGEHINGAQTLDENISDNEGVRIGYRAYKSWIYENGPDFLLPGLNYTAEQLFWISAASSSCTKYRFLNMWNVSEDEKHSPQDVRILGSFANQKEFADDFNCSVGSKMNPAEKCRIW